MLKKYIRKISEGQDLNKAEMIDAMTSIMEGNVSPEQVSAFLIAMKMKKESPVEIAASAQVMMEKATKLPVHIDDVLDIVGTGGDCLNTFNISTTSACSSKKADSSSTLYAMDVPTEWATGAVRVSFSNDNTKEEVEQFINVLHQLMKQFSFLK